MGCEGSHLNGDRQDNRLENLVWETPKELSAKEGGIERCCSVCATHTLRQMVRVFGIFLSLESVGFLIGK